MQVDFVFLDSGIGGIPYFQYLKEIFPQKKCAYYADSENFPYGIKSTEQIIVCITKAVKNIIQLYNPQIIVLACNTMTVTGLQYLRETFTQIDFVGTVPAIKLAAKLSQNKKIGLLATEKTVSHEYTKKLIQDFAMDCQVFSRADTDLINFIEKNLNYCISDGNISELSWKVSEEEKLLAIKPAVDFFLQNKVDTIVLGCTHFVHLVEEFKKLAGPSVKIVDSREGVVKQSLKLAHTRLERISSA